jgi:hypothetical protein
MTLVRSDASARALVSLSFTEGNPQDVANAADGVNQARLALVDLSA